MTNYSNIANVKEAVIHSHIVGVADIALHKQVIPSWLEWLCLRTEERSHLSIATSPLACVCRAVNTFFTAAGSLTPRDHLIKNFFTPTQLGNLHIVRRVREKLACTYINPLMTMPQRYRSSIFSSTNFASNNPLLNSSVLTTLLLSSCGKALSKFWWCMIRSVGFPHFMPLPMKSIPCVIATTPSGSVLPTSSSALGRSRLCCTSASCLFPVVRFLSLGRRTASRGT